MGPLRAPGRDRVTSPSRAPLTGVQCRGGRPTRRSGSEGLTPYPIRGRVRPGGPVGPSLELTSPWAHSQICSFESRVARDPRP